MYWKKTAILLFIIKVEIYIINDTQLHNINIITNDITYSCIGIRQIMQKVI